MRFAEMAEKGKELKKKDENKNVFQDSRGPNCDWREKASPSKEADDRDCEARRPGPSSCPLAAGEQQLFLIIYLFCCSM